jgi:hypothetical protein
MIKTSSIKYLSLKNRKKYLKFRKKFNDEIYLQFIKKGTLPRPHYALGLYYAAVQAKSLGYKKIKILEFGCHNFEGLIDLENHIADIKSFIKIEFEVYGFTLKEGLPYYPLGNFNRYYRWSPKEYAFNNTKNLKKLKISNIIFGDVKETVDEFLRKKKFEHSPIGFIIFDLDLYTSTKYALKILKLHDDCYLPRLINYFDDNSFSSIDEGELRAIEEFNKKSKRKISIIYELAEQLSIYFKKWIFLGKRFRIVNFFRNKYFNEKTPQIFG